MSTTPPSMPSPPRPKTVECDVLGPYRAAHMPNFVTLNMLGLGDDGHMNAAVTVERNRDFVTITMNRPDRRNALSLDMLTALTEAFREVGASEALGVVLAANGPVFSAGHDFRDVGGADHASVRRLLQTCTELMDLMQQIPQPVVARVHGLATAAGCQLVASCDLAVAAESAGFAAPGGKGGWFCHTPMVAIARNV